ncbi:hypothetical protein M378DRAFT_15438 [Amanita muscaria Koide BX008]|uniref:Uncharacterized protein n=1 Tax=Amanita muscaria (strain Koide BX008) TaxID=946122 RepID=A0A0C2S777_AMAMK|nr:hypothetical protein M378DRAFT_15438 [Amanita muscaria Koide BX008]
MFNFFKQVVTFRTLKTIGNALDVGRYPRYNWVTAYLSVSTLHYANATNRTLSSLARFAGLRDLVTFDFENSTIPYCVDAFCISMGALMGTSLVTTFIESATGISEGGKPA